MLLRLFLRIYLFYIYFFHRRSKKPWSCFLFSTNRFRSAAKQTRIVITILILLIEHDTFYDVLKRFIIINIYVELLLFFIFLFRNIIVVW